MRWGGACCAVIACAGCSLFTSFGELSEGDDPPDASADATTSGAASDGGADASSTTDGSSTLPAGLLPNPGFESSGASCAPSWVPDIGSSETSTFARTGSKACKVCAPAGDPDGYIYAKLPYRAGQWSAQAWFHPAEGATAATGTRIEIEFYRGTNYVTSNAAGVDLTPGAGWEKAQVSASTTDTTVDEVHIEVGGSGPNGACVLIDDVIVERN